MDWTTFTIAEAATSITEEILESTQSRPQRTEAHRAVASAPASLGGGGVLPASSAAGESGTGGSSSVAAAGLGPASATPVAPRTEHVGGEAEGWREGTQSVPQRTKGVRALVGGCS